MLNKIFKKTHKQNPGFTIIEMMVSIAIITVISGIFLMNYKSADRQFLLDQAAQQLAGDLRRAQGFALGQKEFNDLLPDGGWGIYLQKNPPNNDYYVLFADADGDNSYDNGENYGNGNKKDIYFPQKTGIDKIIVTNGTGDHSNNKGTVSFMAPDASIKICDQTGSCDNYYQMKITVDDDIRPNKTGNTKTITINKYGLIDID